MKGLKEKRIAKGVSQTWVGLKIGVKRNTVCQWENGKRSPNITILKMLSDLFNCNIEELL